MAIFINADSRVIVQGMTGSEGIKHTTRMLASGTQIVGGVNPRKAGTSVSFPGADGTGRWQARSEAAWVSPKAEQVHLMRKVEMVGPAADGVPGTRFDTERLVVFPDAERATSDERVTVTRPDSILSGTGLRVDMQAKRFQLLNDVKGRYAPARR